MRDGSVRLLTLQSNVTGKLEIVEKAILKTGTVSSSEIKPFGLRTVAFSPDGTLVAAAGHGSAVYVWNIEHSNPRYILNAGADVDTINTVTFGPDGSTLVSAGMDGIINFYDLRQGIEARRITTRGPILNAAVSSDKRYLVTSSLPDEEATVYDFQTGEELRRFSGGPQQSVWSMAISSDNRVLATGMHG